MLSFLLQAAAIGLLHTYRFRTTDNHFAFGWEMGCIGRSIALGRGFSDPFCVPTGPSAWEPPVYPYLIGAVFKLFGIYSNVSAWVLLIFNSFFSAVTCVPIYLIARRIFDERVARWSVWSWALLPYVWYWSIHWVWDTTLSPFLLAAIFLLTLELEDWAGMKGWLVFGLLWGVTALVHPSLLSFLPVSGIWAWYRRSRNRLPSLPGVVVASVVFVACLAPWLIRNHEVFGRFVFLRDDFGQQLRLGNGPDADGRSMVYLQPNLNPHELDRFRTMGELAYAEARKREAYEFIREHPGRTAVIDLKKFLYYWAGIPKTDAGIAIGILRHSVFLASSVLAIWGLILAIRQRKAGAWLFGLLVLSYPTVYYFVYAHARYRHPIEPELLILLVFLVGQAIDRRRTMPK
jgi:4-amino-4-deoxy-L-arabinose transferase-like glycosyltransferase